MNSQYSGITDFIHGISGQDLPANVLHQARRCLLDLIGVAVAGTATPLSRIIRDHAYHQAGGSAQSSRLLFDGRRVGASYAALANAGTIDSMDGHDGHRLVKGHAGAAALPAVLAFVDQRSLTTVENLLVGLIVAYEVSLRAGIVLHRTAADYHSSGAWNALGAAAVGARILRLSPEATRHALGIAEYSAPRAPMMRTIEHPTMVKDSSAWGAQAGVDAAYLAAGGFTGAPAELMEEHPEIDDLGQRWRITEQYFKIYPVCRWAHPAVQAGLSIRANQLIQADQIHEVEVTTFAAAARLHTTAPQNTEQAQYSLPYALAAALVHGKLTPENVLHPTTDANVLRLSQKIRLIPSADMTAEFPAQRRAKVLITLKSGHSYSLETTDGNPEVPVSDATLHEKYRQNTQMLDRRRSQAISDVIFSDVATPLNELMDLITEPP
ncbi:MmgE/PrpD family protein [Arthrobacter sp. CAN_A214]|uniref:MmgE/PrpD family protein n=1 Tax=Arthrobacter sp. CAN_A214 TaxID=2787720 RepID=UPI0018CAF364